MPNVQKLTETKMELDFVILIDSTMIIPINAPYHQCDQIWRFIGLKATF